PEDCLVFEDAENGVEAARSARMSSVWVQDLRFAGDGPVESMATEHITSLLEFDPVKYGLPAYD
ncbi:hypothetical protein IWW41_004679, partial [Coemansia sp. RSA 2522]